MFSDFDSDFVQKWDAYYQKYGHPSGVCCGHIEILLHCYNFKGALVKIE